MPFLVAFQWPSKLEKKIKKEINLTLEIDNYRLEAVEVDQKLNKVLKIKITGNNLFKLFVNEQLKAYLFVDQAPSKSAKFDYMVLFDKDLIIIKTKVLTYREDYGGEISSKRWLKQFSGLDKDAALIYEKDIIAISGATISANSMTTSVNNLLQSLSVLDKHQILK